MTTPRVSVCIVTYNHERYIHDCLMSVVAQAHDVPTEILIGDDQSTDLTEEIVRALAARFPDVVRYFRHEERLGPGGNYQFLIGRARGEYIAHLDGDDYWLPGKLAQQVSVLDGNAEVIASYTNALCVDDFGKPKGVFNNPQPDEFGIEYIFRNGNFLSHSSLVYRSRVKQEICGWASDFLDYKIHLMLASKGRLSYVNTLGVVYRMNSSTSMILNQGEKVRVLYWEAISYASLENIPSYWKRSASADFLRRVAFRAIKTQSLKLFIDWWRVVSEVNDNEKCKLALNAVVRIAATAYRESTSRFSAIAGGTRLRVIYWR